MNFENKGIFTAANIANGMEIAIILDCGGEICENNVNGYKDYYNSTIKHDSYYRIMGFILIAVLETIIITDYK